MPDVAIRLEVELLEDLHAGTGMGFLSLVDDRQARDGRGYPCVPSTTVRGLLRAAAEDWVRVFEAAGGSTEELQALKAGVVNLLGRQGSDRGILVATGWRVDESEVADPQELVRRVTSTAREVFSRSPREGTLRTVECAVAGTRLHGEVRLPAAGVDDDRVQLVQRLLRRVDVAGGGRTPGLGGIRMTMAEAVQLPDPEGEASGSGAGSAACLQLVLENLEPLNIATTGVAGNLVPSLSWIPGSVLRGALLTWISGYDSQSSQRLSEASAMQVGDALPVPADWCESPGTAPLTAVPLPLSIREAKPGLDAPGAGGEEGPWWARRDAVDDRIGSSGEVDLVGLKAGTVGLKRIRDNQVACLRGEEPWRRVRPRLETRLRNRVDVGRRDRRGEVDRDDDAALFVEGAIPERQVFVARVVFPDPEAAGMFQRLAARLCRGDLADRGWIGVGRGTRPVRVRQATWVDPVVSSEPNPDRMVLTLSSHLLLRRRDLAFCDSLELDALLDAARESVTRWAGGSDAAGGEPGVDRLVVSSNPGWADTDTVYGFNSATGLPRAPALALRRGSVYECRVAEDSPEARQQLEGLRRLLVELEARSLGVGDRVAEGLGRIHVDLSIHADGDWPGSTDRTTAEESGTVRLNVGELVFERARQFLNQDRNEFASQLAKAQWNWLRNLAWRPAGSDAEIVGFLRQAVDEHAETIGGRQWQDLPGRLFEEMDRLAGQDWLADDVDTDGLKVAFLRTVCRLAVAGPRGDSR
jgi:CRISPR/Cas system CSM-associated protein Csm3 (group 7 of RAMP superfamily)